MNYIGSNLLSIIAATLAGVLIGVAFHAVPGPSTSGRRRIVALLILALVAEFWLASILAGALILAPVQANGWVIAVGTAVVIWIGFVLPVLGVSYVARRLQGSALAADGLQWLLVMVAQATVLHLMGLTKP